LGEFLEERLDDSQSCLEEKHYDEFSIKDWARVCLTPLRSLLEREDESQT
jgi:hypothetical protein